MTDRAGAGGLAPIAPIAAAQFLTRLPIRLREAPELGRSAPWFPFVGGVIGAAVGLVIAGLAEVVPMPVAATCGLVFGIALTGAFHEDGLADTFDAFGGFDPERRREILKDSRHGSYGVVAMCSTIVLRIVCLASLGPASAFAAVVAAHSLGRAAAVGVMATAPPVPTSGLGADYVRSIRPAAAWAGVASGVAIAAVATGWWAAPLVAAVVIGTAAATRVFVRAFEGIAGDQLGAIEQIGECIVLVVASGLAMNHQVWWA